MLLIDTSVILELLLGQENAAEGEQLLRAGAADRLHITDFALHSVGVILLKRGMHEVFLRAVEDMLLTAGVRLLSLGAEDMQAVVANARKFTLSFDDAYQYSVVAAGSSVGVLGPARPDATGPTPPAPGFSRLWGSPLRWSPSAAPP